MLWQEPWTKANVCACHDVESTMHKILTKILRVNYLDSQFLLCEILHLCNTSSFFNFHYIRFRCLLVHHILKGKKWKLPYLDTLGPWRSPENIVGFSKMSTILFNPVSQIWLFPLSDGCYCGTTKLKKKNPDLEYHYLTGLWDSGRILAWHCILLNLASKSPSEVETISMCP
jgi:hypothetical protein